MSEFTEILGNRKNIEHLSESYSKGKLSHAYIINGPKGSGKRTLVNYISAALMCEETGSEAGGQQDLFSMFGIQAARPRTLADGPCGQCSACAKTSTDNHPDIIRLKREKEKLISVKDVRQQVIADMAIKPYYGAHKVYIIEDAQLMNENAQNALLKTIEEPPEYGIIFLLTDNADALLDTIRSRCIRLDMEKLPSDLISDKIREGAKLAKEQADVFAAFSGGNLGRAMSLAKDEEESDFAVSITSLLKKIRRMNAADIFDEAVRIGKEGPDPALEIMQMWFRDMLIVKAGSQGSTFNGMYFPSFSADIAKDALRVTFEGINSIFASIDTARSRLTANVKAEAALENLLLSIRRVFKEQTESNTGKIYG